MRPAIVLILLLAVLTQPVLAEDKPAGLGLELRPTDDGLVVTKVLAGGPAARAGIQEGERIVAIDGQTTVDRSVDELSNLWRLHQGPAVTLTVAAGGRAPRQLRINREPIDVRKFKEGMAEDAAVLAAARAHVRALARREAVQEALVEQADLSAETLREALPKEIEFMAKVGELSAQERELLKKNGEQAIERRGAMLVRRNARGGLRVAVVVNGQNQVRQVVRPETSAQAVRRELSPLLQSISREAREKFDAERGRLDQRRRGADVFRQVAAFDETLLLTGEQREQFCQLLTTRWGDFWRGLAHESAADPAQLCASAAGGMDLFSIPDVELEEILRPSQVAAFKLVQLPTRLETVFVQPAPQDGQAAVDFNDNEGAVPVRLLRAMPLRAAAAGKVARHGPPLEEERQRLTSLLERLVEDADVHTRLDDGEKQKLILAGKLDLDRHFQRFAELDKLEPGQIVVAAQNQIAGTKVRLPPIFADPASMFQKTLHRRLTPDQLERLAEVERERGRFHRQAVVMTLTVTLAQRAALTASQAERVEERLADNFVVPADAGDRAAWRRATLEGLGSLRADDFKPLLDDWQWPAAREYLNELAATARDLAAQPADSPPLEAPEDVLLDPAAP